MMDPSQPKGGTLLIHPTGPAERLDAARAHEAWERLASTDSTGEMIWRRIYATDPEPVRWIHDRAGLPEAVIEALLAPQTQPRVHATDRGLLVILRGVNLNPDAAPEDMVSVRLWVERSRVVSVALRQVQTIRQLRQSLERGDGPRTTGDLLAAIASGLVDRAMPIVQEMIEKSDSFEEQVIDESVQPDMAELAALRRKAMVLRRYLTPQRDALRRLSGDQHPVLTARSRTELGEAASDADRIVADLELIRERAMVLADEQQRALASQASNTVFYLTVIAGIFLPLSLLTGLLGINVGGIPLAESPRGFLVVAVILVVLGLVEIAIMARLRWISVPGRRRRG
jgi:zinc transporter